MEEEQPIEREDSTPTIAQQAQALGWKSEYYNFGKAEDAGVDYFNPAIVERPDGIWMLVRRSEHHPNFRFGVNSLFAFMMDEAGKVPKMGIKLKWPTESTIQQFEDPRAFYHPGINQTIISACTFIWHSPSDWTGAHQAIGAFDETWVCKKMDYPRIGGNPGRMEKIPDRRNYEKNWLPFLHEGHLHILYKANPWLIVGFGNNWHERKEYKHPGLNWAYGDIRGGTTPVKVGNYYFTFHHSSLPWKGRYRRYYAGCLAFDAEPPFRPRLITPEPILRGSQNDVWGQRKPVVIFPCGALHKNGKWLVTCGVNDLKSAWVELDHESLLKLMRPIDEVGTSIFEQSGLSEGEQKKNGQEELTPRQKQAAKARAVLAEKRALGLVKTTRRRKKRKRILATTTG